MATTDTELTRPIAAPKRRDRYRWQLAIMLTPYLLGLFGLIILPLLLVVPIAFTDYDALSAPEWVGFDNFVEMAGQTEFLKGLSASLIFIVLAVPLRVAGALLLALLLYKVGRGVSFFRSAVYLPTIIPEVAYALLWLYIFNPLFGPLNGLLGLFRNTAPVGTRSAADGTPDGWLINPVTAQVAIVLMFVWTIGEGFVLLMAARQDIPHELHEAAAIDGAGKWQAFRNITLPLLAPFLLLLTFRDTVLSFQATFIAALILTRGSPYYATNYVPYWAYFNASDFQRYGYAAAMTLVILAVSAVIILLQFTVVRRWRAAYFD